MGLRRNNKVLYFECSAGISGDMVLGALIHLGVDAEELKRTLAGLNIGPFNLVPNYVSRSGVAGVDLQVLIYDEPQHDHDYDLVGESEDAGATPPYPAEHDHEHLIKAHDERCKHTHTTYRQIKSLIENSGLSAVAKRMAVDIFTVIGKAEAAVHGKGLEDVTFHEVGAMDSILDIVGTAVAVERLGAEKILCGPVHDGQGVIECRHGLIPVPVPAVMEMLKDSDIPIIVETEVATEMVTPTGFGILKGLKAEFRPTVGLRPEKVGYGFGKRVTGRFGAVRAIFGEEYA
ncbi:MAG: LarC family nickel insertion protein [Clostridiales Family XIII bacterium]|jgi:uncharacterized protein (TIGR00299 family) protein|nr:LarC family nickel insertion protein [Clostridiales Family XIII bacterium]